MNTQPLDVRHRNRREAPAFGRFRAATLALVVVIAFAAAAPTLAAGDAATGKAMHAKDCVACHARKFDGDSSKIYTRAERKVTTPAKLKAQIAMCNTELGTGYFPEEEEHLATYLELTYYKFK